MPQKIMLVGEPMGLFIANETGALDTVSSFSAAVAGAEFNVAVGLSRLEHKVGYLTKLGNDTFGRRISHAMEQNGISSNLISFSDKHSTGFMLKSKVQTGDPEISYFRKNSAASTICCSDIDKIDFSSFSILHMTGIFPALSQTTMDTAKYMMSCAKSNGLTVFFDPNLRPQLWKSREIMVKTLNQLACKSDYFLPGVKEGEALMGSSEPQKIADYYLSRNVKHVIIKTGKAGAFAFDDSGSFTCPTYQEDKIVDTVGAGDGFAAGVLSAINEGLTLKEAVKRGNAIGTIQVQSIGDNDGLPTREELKHFMKTHSLKEE
jgi:2-dehydro-3-deoxygluconokinase